MVKTWCIIVCLLLVLKTTAQQLPEMVMVAGGVFVMGDERADAKSMMGPVHQVKLDSFYMSRMPVTVGQWKYYCEITFKKMPDPPSWGWIDNHPMVNITWQDAVDYTDWLSSQLNAICRLPTEAEWEYAARGGVQNERWLYAGSSDPALVAWLGQDSIMGTAAVGTKQPNSLGLYDMSGNVWEWCRDWYGWYGKKEEYNPVGVRNGRFRVVRGASWYNENAYSVLTQRLQYFPSVKYDYLGFRVVQIVKK